MDLGGETGDLCSCWMGAHSDDPKSISRTHNFPSLELVTPEKTCDLNQSDLPKYIFVFQQLIVTGDRTAHGLPPRSSVRRGLVSELRR